VTTLFMSRHSKQKMRYLKARSRLWILIIFHAVKNYHAASKVEYLFSFVYELILDSKKMFQKQFSFQYQSKWNLAVSYSICLQYWKSSFSISNKNNWSPGRWQWKKSIEKGIWLSFINACSQISFQIW
jgi:hypothetical protein